MENKKLKSLINAFRYDLLEFAVEFIGSEVEGVCGVDV